MESIINYPRLIDRVKAIFVDTIILFALMSIVDEVLSKFDNTSAFFRIAAFVVIFVLYDPVMVTFFGGTLGPKIVGLKVKRESNSDKNINIIAAIFRFLMKALLGWISLVTVTSDDKKRAMHDSATGSMVLYK